MNSIFPTKKRFALALVSLAAILNFPNAGLADWAGYAADPSGFVDTGDWLGKLHTTHAPWVMSELTGDWWYAPDPGPQPEGAWIFFFNPEGIEPVVKTVDLAEPAGSLRFPYNNHETDNPEFKGLLKQSVTNYPTMLASDGAFFAKLRLPLSRMWENRSYNIIGTGGSGGKYWYMSYNGGDYWSGSLRNRLKAYLRGTSGDTINILSAPVTEKDILAVFRRDGDQFALDWYSLTDGSYHPGEAMTGTSNGTNGNRGTFWTVGYASISDSVSALSTPNGAFPGEISHLGYANISTSQQDWQDIALGADPLDVLGGDNLPYYRRLRGPDAESLAAASPADLAPALEIIPGNEALEPGSTIGRQAASGYLTLDNMPDGFVYGLRAGEEGLIIPFSGTTDIDGEVQIQLVYENGTVHRDWLTIATAADGIWSGETYVRKCSQGWLVARARIKGMEEPVAEMRSRFAVGYKVGMMGQSQMSIFMGTRNATQPLTNPGRYSVAHWHTADGATGAQINPMVNIDAPSGPVITANQLDAYAGRDDTPILFVSLAKAGESALEIINDSQTDWQWSQLAAINDLVGQDYTCLVWQWGSADVGRASAYKSLLDAVVYGTGSMASDHYIHDGSIFQDEPPMVLSPFSRQATTAEGPFDFSQGDSYATMRSNQIAWFEENGMTVGPNVSDMRVGPGGGPHQEGDGNLFLGQRIGVGIARYLGLDETQNPTVNSFRFTSTAYDSIRVTFNLPNGGSLKTNGQDNAVSGFEISTDGGSTWSRSGFSAVIDGDTVLLDKETGSWPESTTRVHFMAGGPLSFGTSVPEDDFLPGVLYESYDLDVLGVGLPIDGSNTAHPVEAP